jgi:hypothetical protein
MHSFQRPDGKFVVIQGNYTNTTFIYDPTTNIFSNGPILSDIAYWGAITIQRPDGKFVVFHGQAAKTTSIYDPSTNTFAIGPTSSVSLNWGSHAIQRPDGKFIIIHGGITNTTNIYDPTTNTISIGPTLTGNTYYGAHSFQRSDGKFVTIHGNSTNTTSIYDPTTNTFSVGPTLSAVVSLDSISIQIPDGRFIVIHGGGIASSSIYDPTSNTFNVGPSLSAPVSTGSHAIQRPDGKFIIIHGGSTKTTSILDLGWALTGTYISEPINSSSLNSKAVLTWKTADSQGKVTAYIRSGADATSLGLATWTAVPYNGASINPSGNAYIQVRFDLEGSLPGYTGVQKNIWLGCGQVAYYRTAITPTLTSFNISNEPDGGNILTLESNNSIKFRFTANGSAYTSENGGWFSGGADLAEYYQSNQKLEAGDLVVLDDSQSSYVKKSTKAFDSKIVGVVSENPGFVAGAYTENGFPIALSGRVPAKVVLQAGSSAIETGDPLTSSDITGYSTVTHQASFTVGKALESTTEWNEQTCPLVSSIEDIVWPDDDGTNPDHPCYRLPNGTYVGKIMIFVNLGLYDPDVFITEGGEIQTNYNVSPEILTSLGYDGAKNEIEAAQYSLTDSAGNIITRIGQYGQLFAAKINAGLISTENLVAKNLIANKIITNDLVSPKANIDHLTATDIQTTSLTATDIQTTSLDTTDLTAKTATISTLYADNIISKQGSIGDLMTAKVSALRDELKQLVETNRDASQSGTITGSSIMSQSSAWSMNIASNSAKITGDLELGNNLIVGAKLTVNGDTQLGNAFVSGTFTAGEIAIKDNFIETTNTALYIQPSQTGSVHIMGDTLVIAEDGNIQINGNLTVSGSLMANLITADEIQANKLTAAEINSNEIKIATDSAQTIVAESGFGAIATSSAKLTSNATAGTATLPAGKTEIVITNNKITANSMVYLTPVGSTNNQVPYIKTKMVYSEAELAADPTLQNYFTISLDNYLDRDIDINWWIIN